MIRTVVKADKQSISIKLSKEFLGKQVEVIAFTVDEADDVSNFSDKPITYLATEMVLAKEWLNPEEDAI